MQNPFPVGSCLDGFSSDSEDSQNSEVQIETSIDLQKERERNFCKTYDELLEETKLDPQNRCVIKIGKTLSEFSYLEMIDFFKENYDSISHISEDELTKAISGGFSRKASLIENLLRPDTLNDPVVLSLDTIKRHLLIFRKKSNPMTKYYGVLNTEYLPGGVGGSRHTHLPSGKTYILIKELQMFLNQARTNGVDYFYLLAKGLQFNQSRDIKDNFIAAKNPHFPWDMIDNSDGEDPEANNSHPALASISRKQMHIDQDHSDVSVGESIKFASRKKEKKLIAKKRKNHSDGELPIYARNEDSDDSEIEKGKSKLKKNQIHNDHTTIDEHEYGERLINLDNSIDGLKSMHANLREKVNDFLHTVKARLAEKDL